MNLVSARVESKAAFLLCWLFAISVVNSSSITLRFEEFLLAVRFVRVVDAKGEREIGWSLIREHSTIITDDTFVSCLNLDTSYSYGDTDATLYIAHRHRSRQVDRHAVPIRMPVALIGLRSGPHFYILRGHI